MNFLYKNKNIKINGTAINVKKNIKRALCSTTNLKISAFQEKLLQEKKTCKYFIIEISILTLEQNKRFINFCLNAYNQYKTINNKLFQNIRFDLLSDNDNDRRHHYIELENVFDGQFIPYQESYENSNSKIKDKINKNIYKSFKQLFKNLLEYSLLSLSKSEVNITTRRSMTASDLNYLKPLKKVEQLNNSLSLCLFLDKFNIKLEPVFYLVIEVNFDGPFKKYINDKERNKDKAPENILLEFLNYLVFYWNKSLDFCFSTDYNIFASKENLHNYVNLYRSRFFLEKSYKKIPLHPKQCQTIHFKSLTPNLITITDLLKYKNIGSQFISEQMRYTDIKNKIAEKKLNLSNKAFDKLREKAKLAKLAKLSNVEETPSETLSETSFETPHDDSS